MRLLCVVALFLAAVGYVSSSPAEPVAEDSRTLLVRSAELAEVPAGDGLGTAQTVLFVTGQLLADPGDAYPRTMVFGEEEATIRLYASEQDRINAGDIIVVEHVGHSVYDGQPTHLIADIITQADRANEALMRIAVHNADVPVLELKRAERILRKEEAPYASEGFETFAEWGLLATFAPIAPRAAPDGSISEAAPEAEGATERYRVEIYPTTGTVNAEWTLEVDLRAGTVEETARFQLAPAPGPGEP